MSPAPLSQRNFSTHALFLADLQRHKADKLANHSPTLARLTVHLPDAPSQR